MVEETNKQYPPFVMNIKEDSLIYIENDLFRTEDGKKIFLVVRDGNTSYLKELGTTAPFDLFRR